MYYSNEKTIFLCFSEIIFFFFFFSFLVLDIITSLLVAGVLRITSIHDPSMCRLSDGERERERERDGLSMFPDSFCCRLRTFSIPSVAVWLDLIWLSIHFHELFFGGGSCGKQRPLLACPCSLSLSVFIFLFWRGGWVYISCIVLLPVCFE